jgi:LEA14-like dessication related protein
MTSVPVSPVDFAAPRSRAAYVAWFVLALGACASLQRPAPPDVVAVDIRNVQVRLPTIRVDVDLELRNPNAVDVAIAALDADLDIAGERAGRARLAAPVTLVAGATTRVTVQAVGDASIALAGLGRALGAARPVDYALSGTLTLADGTIYPFVRRGQVATGAMRP